MSEKILVIGATGKTGSILVTLLADRGQDVRAGSRTLRTDTAGPWAGVENVVFDFEQPRTFRTALNGVTKVFLMARPGDNQSDKVAIPFVDEARLQGVRLIVNLTAMGVEQDDDFPLRVLEKYIEASGIPFTHLRPNWFMQNFASGSMLADIRNTGAIHLPAADAKISFIDVRDIAAVGCAMLTEQQHAGKAYTLTGAKALDHHEVAALLSRVSGKKISYVPLNEDVARATLTDAGVPADLIERWADFYRIVRQGACAAVSQDVANILKRSPILFEQYAAESATSWK